MGERKRVEWEKIGEDRMVTSQWTDGKLDRIEIEWDKSTVLIETADFKVLLAALKSMGVEI